MLTCAAEEVRRLRAEEPAGEELWVLEWVPWLR